MLAIAGGLAFVINMGLPLVRRSMAGGALARPELCLTPILFAAVLFFWSPSR